MSDRLEVMDDLSSVIAEMLWDEGAEEEGGRRESSPYGGGGGDDIRYWNDLEDFERRALASNQRTAALAVWRAGYRKVATE